jgi:hypothetical protein
MMKYLTSNEVYILSNEMYKVSNEVRLKCLKNEK